MGLYGCLYTSLSRRGAVAEFEKALAQSGIRPDEYQETDLVTVIVEVKKVLDLTDPTVLQRMGLSEDLITADTAESRELCRSIADVARADFYSAILSPSAARKGEKNLNIYIDGRAANLRLDVGSHREPLNYSFG